MPDSGLTVHEVTRRADLGAHLPAWEQLGASAPYGEWFASPHWVLPWLDAFGNPDGLAIQFVYDGAQLLGVLPLVQSSTARAGCAPTHTFPVNSHVRRIGALSAIPIADLLTVVFEHARLTGRLSCWALPQIPVGGEFHRALDTALSRTRLLEFSREESRSAVANFDGGWDEYTKRLKPTLLRKLRQKQQKLERDGDWTFRVITEPADWAAGFSDVLSVEAKSWKHSERTSIVNEPGTRTLYEGVGARSAAAGMLRLHIAMYQGMPAAHALCVVSRGTCYLLKNSFAEEHKTLSAGTVVVWHAMAAAAANGCHHFDFLGDAIDWKLGLSTTLPAYQSSTVFPASHVRCLVCRVREQTLKPLARRVGLAGLLRPLRRLVG